MTRTASACVVTGFVIALAACGSTPYAQSSARPSTPSAVPPAQTSSSSSSSSSASASAAAAALARRRPPSRLDRLVGRAKATYNVETAGGKLHGELGRIARDGVLLSALSRGDVAGAQAEADAQLRIPLNHFAHVTRIGVNRGSRVLVNATVNSDGVFVVAPATRVLRAHGRVLGTLLVSIQDVTGYVKLVHDITGADALVRGASGRVRSSLGAAAGVRLPSSGSVTIAGSRYFVRSFGETGWGNEPSAGERLTVWVLERG